MAIRRVVLEGWSLSAAGRELGSGQDAARIRLRRGLANFLDLIESDPP